MPEAQVMDILVSQSVTPRNWTTAEKKKFIEAYEMFDLDYTRTSNHIGTRSIGQVKEFWKTLKGKMQSNPNLPM